MRHDQSAYEKSDYGFERRQLQVAQSGDGVTGRTTSGVSASETDQNASDHEYENHFGRLHGLGTENGVGHQFALRRVDSHFGQLFDRRRVDVDVIR